MTFSVSHNSLQTQRRGNHAAQTCHKTSSQQIAIECNTSEKQLEKRFTTRRISLVDWKCKCQWSQAAELNSKLLHCWSFFKNSSCSSFRPGLNQPQACLTALRSRCVCVLLNVLYEEGIWPRFPKAWSHSNWATDECSTHGNMLTTGTQRRLRSRPFDRRPVWNKSSNLRRTQNVCILLFWLRFLSFVHRLLCRISWLQLWIYAWHSCCLHDSTVATNQQICPMKSHAESERLLVKDSMSHLLLGSPPPEAHPQFTTRPPAPIKHLINSWETMANKGLN